MLGPGSCVPLPADLEHLSEVERLVKELSSRESLLHVLVNNAGLVWGEDIDSHSVRQCQHNNLGISHIYPIGRSVHPDSHCQLAACVYAHSEVFAPPACCCKSWWA